MSMLTPRPSGNRVRDRVHDRRDRAGGAGFADALHAERIGGRRHVVARLGDRRHVGRARHRVVHERAGDELPVAVVVDGVLHQRLPDALREAADELARDQRVIEHDAGIVHRRIGDDLDHAGIRIDLDLGDVAAVREGLRRVDRRLGVERVAGRPCARAATSNSETRRSVPTTSKCPLAIGDVGLGRFQHAGGDRLRLLQHQVDGAIERAADRHGGARADRRIALQVEIGVAVPMRDLRGRNAELRADQARIDRGVALAGVLHADAEHQLAVAGKQQRCALGRQPAGMFEEARDADAAQLLAPERLAAALLELGVVRKRQRLVEDRREVAGVVGRADRASCRELLRAGSDCAAAAGPDRCR